MAVDDLDNLDDEDDLIEPLTNQQVLSGDDEATEVTNKKKRGVPPITKVQIRETKSNGNNGNLFMSGDNVGF